MMVKPERLKVFALITYLVALVMICDGFVPTNGRIRRGASAYRIVDFRCFSKKSGDDTEPLVQVDPIVGVEDEKKKGSDSEKLQARPESRSSSGIRKAVQRGLFGISMVWAYLTIAFGIFMTFGMMLNLFGYAYQLTESGLIIDTIQHVREDNMFRAAVMQSIQERRP